MSNSLSDCCQPCNTVTTTAIPGPQGNQGIPGTDGADGNNAYAIVQAPGFVIPTVGNDVLAPVNSTLWMTVGEIVIAGTGFGGPVTGPANFQVISINSATTVTLRALAYPGDAVNPATIAASALLAPAGLQGPTGAAGSTFPTTTAGDLMVNNDGVAAHAARFGIGAQGQILTADPSGTLGAGAALILWKGGVSILNVNITSVGTGADLTEDNLMSYSVPANTLRASIDAIEIEAVFDVVATATVATKTIKIKYGGTTVLQFGSAALNGGSISMKARITRVNNTSQFAFAQYLTTDGGGTATALLTRTSPGETLSGAVLIQCTGQNGTNAVALGIVQQYLRVTYLPAA